MVEPQLMAADERTIGMPRYKQLSMWFTSYGVC